MNTPIPQKGEILAALWEAQQRILPLLTAADAHKNQGNLRQSHMAFEQLIDILQKTLQLEELNNQYYPDSPFDLQPTVHQLLNSMNMDADVVEVLGHPEMAEAGREKAAQLADTYLAEADIAENARQRAASRIAQGRFNEALVALTSARDVFQARQDALNTASVTTDLAGLLEWLGDYDRALAEVKRATEFIAPFISRSGPATVDARASSLEGNLQNLEQTVKLQSIRLELAQIEARSNRYLGNFVAAERQFQAILPQTQVVARPAIEFHLAMIAIGRGRYQAGLAALNQLEPTFRGLLRLKLGVLLSGKGEALLQLGRADEALSILDAAVQELSRYRDNESLWMDHWRRARALADLKRPHEALKAYGQAIATVNNLRKAPLGYRLDSTYLRDKMPVFEAAIRLACESGEGHACCQFIEAIKSRALATVLSIPAGEQPQMTGESDRQVDDLTRQIDALEYAAYRDGLTDDLEKQKASLLALRANLLEQIRFSDPRWRSLSEPVLFDLPKLVDLLGQRQQAALTLFYQPEQVIGVLIYDGQCIAASVQLSDETRRSLVRYQENLHSLQPNPEWFDLSSGLHLAAEHLIPAQLLEPALQAKSLIIAPHGPLHLVPWAGLAFRGKRLLEACPIGILPNLTCVQSLAAEFSIAPQVALIGAPDYRALRMPPLLQAEVELQEIEQIYLMHGGIVGQIFTGKEATETHFWALAKHPTASRNILHISSHGTFEADDPMNSGLLFTDARVNAAEIARTRLRYDEVILSACSTGYRPTEVQGIVLSGDDILGLPGALLESGVRSVLVSIPPAREDASRRFMTLYHESRAEGTSPLFAFQKAQETILNECVYAPFLWIGFTVYGYQ